MGSATGDVGEARSRLGFWQDLKSKLILVLWDHFGAVGEFGKECES